MKKAQKSTRFGWPSKWRKSLWLIPALGLLAKFIVISQIPSNAWLGADGENYLRGLEFLMRDGFLSQESILHYWPAGYPLMMWVLGAFAPQWTLPIMAVLQSFFYAFSVAYFSQKLNETSLRRYALAVSLILTMSPTLALNTMAIGYELISASVFLIALGLFISLGQISTRKVWDWRILVMGALFSVNNFVQPRFLLSSLIFLLFTGFFLYKKQLVALVVLLGISISFFLPSIMIIRNSMANDFATISTNLGVTMRLGAGDGATGGYVPTFAGVECPQVEGDAAQIDQALVKCTIDWYVNNPKEILRLSVNKSIFFWSPWLGPIANGSMARNPWLKVNPFYDIATESQEGYDLVFGLIGKVVSWLWLIGYLAILIFGAMRLSREGELGKRLVAIISATIAVNWLISLGTLGDHRQRVPILSLVVFLQIIGWMNISRTSTKKKIRK